ncbi:hypothetical protein VYU27_007537 [Nannochloropsis oceanica]
MHSKPTSSSRSSSSSFPSSIKLEDPPINHPPPPSEEEREGRQGGKEGEDYSPLLSCCLQSWEEQLMVVQKKMEGGIDALREEADEGVRKDASGRLRRVQGMMREEVLPLVVAMQQGMAAMRARVG